MLGNTGEAPVAIELPPVAAAYHLKVPFCPSVVAVTDGTPNPQIELADAVGAAGNAVALTVTDPVNGQLLLVAVAVNVVVALMGVENEAAEETVLLPSDQEYVNPDEFTPPVMLMSSTPKYQ